MQSVEFEDLSASSLIVFVGFTGETFLEQFRGRAMDGPLVLPGSPMNDRTDNLCFEAGRFPTNRISTYLECLPNPQTIVKPSLKSCPENYAFSSYAEMCIHFNAVDILLRELGFRVGPVNANSVTLPGSVAPINNADVAGSMPLQCVAPGINPIVDEDRMYLMCQGPTDKGKSCIYMNRL